MRRLGGVIPIPRRADPRTVEVHLEAARRVLEAGAIFMLMPETGRPSEPGQLRRIGLGLAYIALRTGAPIVPLVLGGNEELYFGRRIILRVLPTIDPMAAGGLPAGARPAPGSSDERAAAHRLTARFAEFVADDVAAVHAAAQPAPGAKQRGRFLTRLFR